MVSPEQMTAALKDILKDAIIYKNSIPLKPGEDEINLILFETGGEIYATFAALDPDNRITRQVEIYKLDQVVENFIKKATDKPEK